MVYKLPLLAENDFLPDLDSIPADVRAKAKLLVLCFPNSPTGKTAPPEFYERVIAFAKKHEIVIVQDAAHAQLSFDREPNSFLSIPGAKDVGVEMHSMSKGFDMIGWRLGWVCGNATIVRAFADVKDNSDSGQFLAIQKAGDRGPRRSRDPPPHPREVQAPAGKARRHAPALRLQVRDARRHVLPLHAVAEGTGRRHERSRTPKPRSQYLITQQSICTVPWDDAGAFLRFSVTYEAADEAAEDALMAETEARLKNIGPVF